MPRSENDDSLRLISIIEAKDRARMWDRIKTAPQYMLPQHFLSRCMHCLARWQAGPLTRFIIRLFIKIYGVNMQEAQRPAVSAYKNFNDFFTRALSPAVRPQAQSPTSIVSPVDGSISQLGTIEQGQILQAKGKDYSLADLLAGEQVMIEKFDQGHFTTIYLSPRDYHRIHMPIEGQLLAMTYVPGQLFSVNDASCRSVDNLFARNERVICYFDTILGTTAVILVGALFVGSMETVWQGPIAPATREKKISSWDYTKDPTGRLFYRGEEMARFNMGSTVILLFEEGRISWSPTLEAGTNVRMGEAIASPAV